MTLTDIAKRALPLLDLTALNSTDTEANLRDLCAKAVTSAGPVAAICIHGPFIPLANELLDQRIGLATVVNFPEGTDERKNIEADILAALHAGADEIDLVFPWQAFLSGKRTLARDIVSAARAVCPTGVLLKVILESGSLGNPTAIREASEAAILSGADFLMTSTGKAASGATPEAARIMLSVICDMDPEVGFKASGNLSDAKDAALYLALADEILGADWVRPDTFRLGSCTLLEDFLKRLNAVPAPTPASPVSSLTAPQL